MVTGAESPSISVELLGPLRLTVDGRLVEVPGPKRRAVLALLALAEGRAVAVDELLDGVWPSDAPNSARAALHSHISRIRGHLGPAASRLEAVHGGYRLRLEREELDVSRARQLLADARHAADTEPDVASAAVREALGLWRGPVLAELADVLPIAARSLALEELRREVVEEAIACGLAAGDASGVIPLATAAMEEDPLREPTVLLLVRSLADAGRTAEALRVAHEHRQRLRRETGLDPSAALDELERAIATSSAHGSATARRLPAPLTPLVGRDAEVTALQRLLTTDRLVTIVGPGGVGKTRVAIDVARRHDDATFLPLAPVTDPVGLPEALAAALDVEAVAGDVLGACVALLAAGPRVLVVDNCEHVLDDVRAVVSTLLESCPELTVLATSRERLGLASERQVRLGPLALPDARAPHPERAPAVAVFLERARRARPAFEPSQRDVATIVDIVRRLDGLPLSIELAAGRLSSLGLDDLHARLDRALDLLEAGPRPGDARHQTLRATIDWSYDLLAESEQRLFRHLSVFPDGVDLRTAELVASDLGVPGDVAATLARLVDASIVGADLDDVPRYRMLETVRAYGLDRLEAAGEVEEARERLIRWAVDLTGWVDESLQTDDEALVNDRLRRELANLRSAWSLARRHPDIDHAIELAVALDDAAQWRDLPELWRWAEDVAADPRIASHPRAAAALASASDAAWLLGHLDHAAQLARQALDAATDDDGRWRALLASAVVDVSRADFAAAIDHALEAAALAPRPAHSYWVAALAATYAGDLEQAERIAARGAATSPTLRAEHEYVAGEIASVAGRLEQAERHYERAMEHARGAGATFIVGIATVGLLTVQGRAGRYDDALRGYAEVIDYWERAGNWIQVWTTLRNLAGLLRTLGDGEAALYLEAAAEHAPESAEVGTLAWASNDGEHAGISASRAAAVVASATTASPTDAVQVAREAIAARLKAFGG